MSNERHEPLPHRRSPARIASVLGGLSLLLAATPIGSHPAGAQGIEQLQLTDQVSVDSAGAGPATAVIGTPFINDDGRFAFFSSDAPLVADDTNGVADVFRHDRLSGRTLRISTDAGAQATDPSRLCGINRSGAFAAFFRMHEGTKQI